MEISQRVLHGSFRLCPLKTVNGILELAPFLPYDYRMLRRFLETEAQGQR
jgi:hypothetical protein